MEEKKDSSGGVSSELEQVENQSNQGTVLEKDTNIVDEGNSEECMNFSFNVRSPLSPMPASPQQEVENCLSEGDGQNKLIDSIVSKTADTKKVDKKKDSSGSLSSELKQLETHSNILIETVLEKDTNNVDEENSVECMDFKFNVRSPLSPMPPSPQQKVDHCLSEGDGKNKLVESTVSKTAEHLTEIIEEDERRDDDGTEFVRPSTVISNRGLTSNTANNMELNDVGRITPPPALLSPFPLTPAGSMTPVGII